MQIDSLEKAISIACEAHTGQVDKSGKPYILHPLAIMSKFEESSKKIVAVLHDVVEDSHFTFEDLRESGFSDEVIEALDCITRRENESYDSFITRVSSNSLATAIKIEDIKNNMDLTRLSIIHDRDIDRVKKYHKALARLKKGFS